MTGKLIPDFSRKCSALAATSRSTRRSCASFSRRWRARSATGGAEAVADGFLAIAVAKMAEAIKTISVARGYDVTRYALNCFGGAGGQHACDVADALAITTVLIHPLSSLLSAYGMGLADIAAQRAQGVDEPLRPRAPPRRRHRRRTRRCGGRRGRGAGGRTRGDQVHARRNCAMRAPTRRSRLRSLRPPRCAAHSRARTRAASASSTATKRSPSRRCRPRRSAARRGSPSGPEKPPRDGRSRRPPPMDRAACSRPRDPFFSHGRWRKANVFSREALNVGAKVDGPALIIEPHQTIVVEQGWRAAMTPKNHVLMTRVEPLPRREAVGAKADPVMLEIFNHLFMSIAEQMGVTLQNTAYSVNIKERLDFSCALFDREGRLVANAPHMPVHLGSMDRSVETIIRDNQGRIRPGDVFALNAPYNGGTHLPDITVCTPVFDEAASHPVLDRFARPSRRHRRNGPRSMAACDHDPGGGSLHRQFPRGRTRPLPRARTLRAAERRPCPARNPLQNVNDLKARIAPTKRACGSSGAWSRCYRSTVEAYMCHVQDNADESVRRVIDRLVDSEAESVRTRARSSGPGSASTRKARGDGRFHRDIAAAGDELQRARAGHPRRRALCVPRDGRRRHPDERRLPEADPRHRTGRLDAVAPLSGGGRGGQCRGVAGGDRHAVRRARRPRLGARRR